MSLHVLAELEQGTEEWHNQRRGIVTASVVGKLISSGPPDARTVDCGTCAAFAGSACLSIAKGKESTPLKNYHPERVAFASSLPNELAVADNDTSRALTATLVAERLTGWTDPTFMSADMWRGVEHEPIARDYYVEHYGPVTQVGFMIRDDWGFNIGYSPDGLVGDDGLLEIKAPRAKTHLLTVLDDCVPAYNMAQLQTGLLVSGREWIDFVPFVGGLPLWRKRVYPDPKWHAAIVAAVTTFEKTAAEMVAAYAQATANLPATERVPDSNLGLVF